MKRKQRTRILITGSHELSRQLSEQVEAIYSVTILQPAETGLVMVKIRESARKSLFYIGEVLVTEVKVLIHGSVGLGIVAGDNPELAFQLAVIDAAYSADLPETRRWTALLEAEEGRIWERRALDQQRLAETLVRFETMDVD